MRKYQVTANYHTHTTRCKHASGSDREYVEKAIESGLKILGFADHTPYPISENYWSGIRMDVKEAEGYFRSLEDLRREYRDDIEIYIGVEAEYYREHFQKLVEFMKDYPLDYMIMGQHFIPEEHKGPYTGNTFTDPDFMAEYVDYVIEGMQTGCFSYVAHPDIINYVGENQEEVMRTQFRRMCMEAKKLNVPLEVNVLGYKRGIQYPSHRLLEVAAECGNDVILGFDTHNPAHFFDYEAMDVCVDMVKQHGLNLLDKLELKKNW